jgi:hypothetical protein
LLKIRNILPILFQAYNHYVSWIDSYT